MGYWAGNVWVPTTEEDKKKQAPTLQNWDWSSGTTPAKTPTAPSPQQFTGAVGGITAKATPSVWDRPTTPGTGANYENEWKKIPKGTMTETPPFSKAEPFDWWATAPQPGYTPQPAATPQPVVSAPAPTPMSTLTDTINNWLRGGQEAVGQIGQAFQQPGPFGASPVQAAPAQPPMPPEPPPEPPEEPGLWDRITGAAGNVMQKVFGRPPGDEVGKQERVPYTPPITPTTPTTTKPTSVSGTWSQGGGIGSPLRAGWDTGAEVEQPGGVTDTGVPEPEEMWGPGNYDQDTINWLHGLGYSPEEMANMSVEDIKSLAKGEQQKTGLEGQRNSVIQELYQMGYDPSYTNSLSTEQLFAMLEGQKDIKGKEERAETREEYFSPEEIAHRQKQYDESQQREMEAYWSSEQVANREKKREEDRKSSSEYGLRGWDTYFDFLDDSQLSPDANEYWDNPARLAELRSRWEAAGKKESWLTFLKNYDLKGEFATKTYRERMGTAAKFAPRMRGVSYS